MTLTEQRLIKRDWTLALMYIPGMQPVAINKKDEFTVSDEVVSIKYANVAMPVPQGTSEKDMHVADVELQINLLMVTKIEFYNQKAIIQPPVNKNMIIAP